jgi:hypothetical protein
VLYVSDPSAPLTFAVEFYLARSFEKKPKGIRLGLH